MLLSPPGCGKSAFAKSLGNETGRPTLVLDVGSGSGWTTAVLARLVGPQGRVTGVEPPLAEHRAPCGDEQVQPLRVRYGEPLAAGQVRGVERGAA